MILINVINDDTFISAVTADACSMVHLVCLLIKTYLLALLQGNCLDLLRCAFLSKLSGCVTNITGFCQHLLRPIKSAVLADTDISAKPKYRPIISVDLYWFPSPPFGSTVADFFSLQHEAAKVMQDAINAFQGTAEEVTATALLACAFATTACHCDFYR